MYTSYFDVCCHINRMYICMLCTHERIYIYIFRYSFQNKFYTFRTTSATENNNNFKFILYIFVIRILYV